MVVGVKKGGHIKRSAFMRAQLLVFKLHLHGEGPICSFFSPLGYSVTDWIKEGFPGCPCFLGE